jgi:hypothetical protein
MQHPGWILAFHGCDRLVGERILAGRNEVLVSANDYDWLGQGAYFWENSHDRALSWARFLKARPLTRKKIKDPFVIGAIIDPGNCLDLSEAGCLDILRAAASEFFELTAAAGKAPPRNERGFRGDKDLVRRKLDCAVINFLHAVRRQTRQPAFNTVRCPFMEGGPLYQDAKITSRTHVQWCVREPKKSVIAYFRPRQR